MPFTEKKINWHSVTYIKKDFRETVIQFENDKNLSRFIFRTAKALGMWQVTLADVKHMLEAADETIWILNTDHRFKASNPDEREPTWIMAIDRKRMYAALMKIADAGWARTYKKNMKYGEKEVEQRFWAFTK